jgi:hypothetical protein
MTAITNAATNQRSNQPLVERKRTMDRKMNEMALRTLGDEELAAASGAKLGLLKKKHPFKTVTQSNTIGDVYVDASCNSGSVSVSISQSNSAD